MDEAKPKIISELTQEEINEISIKRAQNVKIGKMFAIAWGIIIFMSIVLHLFGILDLSGLLR